MVDEYYVYAYYLKSTNEIFHIGKGKKDRYKDTINHRNDFFKNIVAKYKDDVDVKIIKDGLSEEDAWELERKLIKEYKKIGQCRTNLHEGGCGGNTGNYNSPQRHEKLSEFAKSRVGEKNPNYRNHWSEEKRALQSQKLKDYFNTPGAREKQSSALKGRIPWNKGTKGLQTSNNKGKKLTPEHYLKMMDGDCPYKYEVYFNDELVYWTISGHRLVAFCKEAFNISRTITEQIISGTWIPKFNRHKHLSTLKIIKTDRSVSTNRDECSDVEWRLHPLQVPGNLNE